MNKSGCKAYVAHHYWHHMDEPKWFFKIMVGDFKNGVTIPKKFVANIREKISEEVTLKVPDGKTYTVEVAEEQQNELIIRSGWAEFASAYELEPGDLLVFTKSGNSHFTVRIFDRSCCEKELSCVPLDSVPCMQDRKGSHGKQMQSPTGKRLADGSPSGSIRKTPKMNPTDSPSPHTKTGHAPSSEEGVHQEPINSGASQKLIKSCIALPTGCSMTSEQEAKVFSLEQKIQSQIPFYITAMYKESLSSGILLISKKYVMEHLANENGAIQVCQFDGSNMWTINLYITIDPHYAVSTGWLEFIRDNKLGEGDICIFQPERGKNGRVKLIFRTLEESSSCFLHSQKKRHVSPTKRHGVAKPPYMLPRHTSPDEQRSKVEEKVGAVQSKTPKMNPADSPSQKKRHVSPTKRHGVAKPPYMLTRHTSTDEQRSKVEKKVGAIQSETPKMNPTDSPSPQKKTEHVPSSEGNYGEPINSGASRKLIKSCIALPTGCSITSELEAIVMSLEQKIQPKIPFYITAMHEKSVASGILAIKKKYAIKHLVNENGTIQLCQLDGSKVWVWPINFDITADGCWAVSKGWMGFTRHNKLQEGDICIFQPSKSKEGVKLIFRSLVQNCRLQPPGYVPSAKSPRHGAAPPYILPWKTSLTDEQKSKVEEKLRGIQSDIPVYVTIIKNSNVKRSLCILEFSSLYARKYLPVGDKSQLTMTMRLRCPGRSKDDEWEPEFRFKQGRYQIVGEGWRKFVTDNKLKLDDICLFNRRKNTKRLTMDVHIIH